jgi:hypothetical protein
MIGVVANKADIPRVEAGERVRTFDLLPVFPDELTA